MPDNSTDVKVGKLIALIVEKGDDWKSVEVPKTEEKGESQKSAKPAAEAKKAEPKEKEQTSQKEKQPVEQSQYVPTLHRWFYNGSP